MDYNLVATLQDLDDFDLVVEGRLTIIGECVEKMPFDLNTSVALLTGAFCGVTHHLALVLAVAANHVFLRDFLQLKEARDYTAFP